MAKGKPHKRKSLFMGITSRVLMIIAAALLVLSYLSMFFNPSKAWFMTLLGIIFIPVWILNVFLLVWALFRRSSAVIIPLVALIPTLFIVGRFYQFPKNAEKAAEGASPVEVEFLSYNVGRFHMASKKSKDLSTEACMDSVAAYILGENPDIVCLQEVQYPGAEAMKRDLSRRFPEYEPEYFVFTDDGGCYGNVTLSKTPAIHKGKIDFDGTANIAIYSDYELHGKRFRVYNCHLQSYNISVSRLAQELKKRISGDTSGGEVIKDTEKKMKSSILRRPGQVEAVLSDIGNSPYEAVVIGDFNDTPLSYTYFKLRKGRNDSFVQAGKGFGATYVLARPFIRIDYILFPDEYHVSSHRAGHVFYSDHFPVSATISIENESKP